MILSIAMKNKKSTLRSASFLSHPAIYTDYYELTMAQGYFLSGRQNETACFDYFFRDLPFEGGYAVFAGIGDVLQILRDFHFAEEELQYLAEQGFEDDFLDFLRNLELSVSILAAKEGEIVFPTTPLLRVEGPIIEAQILETLLLNILNFETLIATKAKRMKFAAGNRKVLDFGMRRAQGLGSLQASKAAIIGGVEATSNVHASFTHDIPASGTMAHSWVQSFESELDSFRAYAKHYPNETTLLVDTYSTLSSGLPNAITVAKELEETGHRLKGIRLDSGDLAYFSRKARNQLDKAGLEYVKIAASNQLDEHLIRSLLNQGAPIDLFGVGTRLVTGNDTPALDGVYKLAVVNDEPTLKISENVEKITLPGRKRVNRYTDDSDMFLGDGILLDDEDDADSIYHKHYPHKYTNVSGFHTESLLHPVLKDGRHVIDIPTAQESARYASARFDQLNAEHKRFDHPHIYKVGISKKLMDIRDKLTHKMNS